MREWAQRRSRTIYSALVKRKKSEDGMRANNGSRSGACSDVSQSRPSFKDSDLPGKRHRHRKAIDRGCREIDLLVLFAPMVSAQVSHSRYRSP